MIQEKERDAVIYEINGKKYTVITKTKENAQNIDKLYDVICKYVCLQINGEQNI